MCLFTWLSQGLWLDWMQKSRYLFFMFYWTVPSYCCKFIIRMIKLFRGYILSTVSTDESARQCSVLVSRDRHLGQVLSLRILFQCDRFHVSDFCCKMIDISYTWTKWLLFLIPEHLFLSDGIGMSTTFSRFATRWNWVTCHIVWKWWYL